MSREVMQQALDALEPLSAYGRVGTRDVDQAALQQVCAALRSALAQPQAEPVGYVYSDSTNGYTTRHAAVEKNLPNGTPLYAAPQQAQPGYWFGDKVQEADPAKWAQQAQPAHAPADMVMVPREPSDDMLIAGQEAWAVIKPKRNAIEDCREADAVYRAMIAAAPGSKP